MLASRVEESTINEPSMIVIFGFESGFDCDLSMTDLGDNETNNSISNQILHINKCIATLAIIPPNSPLIVPIISSYSY